jgi:hypothetical protein
VDTIRVEACALLAPACGVFGEIILFLGRERNWYEPAADGSPRSFLCSGCGVQLTLANQCGQSSPGDSQLGRLARSALTHAW